MYVNIYIYIYICIYIYIYRGILKICTRPYVCCSPLDLCWAARPLETCAAVAAAMEGGARGQVWCLTEALTAAKDRRDSAAETSMICAS